MKMNKTIKKKWIAALRSGDYAQGTESLCRQDYNSEEYHFCCLGVLCDISNPSRWTHFEDEGQSMYHFENGDTGTDMPSWHFLESLGIAWNTAETLAHMNDEGKSFETISNWIEENL